MPEQQRAVVHLVPHLGGGVGKALSGLISEALSSGSSFRHEVICFEQPERLQFVDKIRAVGVDVFTGKSIAWIKDRVAGADIVQLEWWNHPSTFEALVELSGVPIRLLTWSHVSGLFTPIVPVDLMRQSRRFISTSRCSYELPALAELAAADPDRFAVVSSSGGFEGLPPGSDKDVGALSVGYLGSLNVSKLHPRYVDYLNAVEIPDFSVRIIGDPVTRVSLQEQAVAAGKPGLLDFAGYTTDVAGELRSINVLAYLLSPDHYGTTENALIEAMATGIVPVVLDNPAERHIVEHGEHGFVVKSEQEFARAIEWLAEHPQKRKEMGCAASRSVRERFSVSKAHADMEAQYLEISRHSKRIVDFADIFGNRPLQWFLACQSDAARFSCEDSRPGLPDLADLEISKGSILHFARYFSGDRQLAELARHVGASV